MKYAKVVILVLFFLSCGSDEPKTEGVGSSSYVPDLDAPAVAVEALIVSQGKLVDNITGSGIIRSAQEAEVVSQQSGKITEVLVSPGDYVEAGAALLTIEDNVPFWEMKRAEQQLKAAEFEYKGIENSYNKGAISEVEYNRSYSQVLNSRAAFEMASLSYENCTLTAPFTGYVSQMNTSLTAGNYLNRGVSILRVINMDRYILEISPGQREIGLIDRGADAVINVSLADRTLSDKGTVLDISAGSNELNGSFPVRIDWDNSWGDQIRPGMTARVLVSTNNEQEGVVIPYDQVIEREGKKWVFLAKDGVNQSSTDELPSVVEAREVTLGARLGNRVLITTGLNGGEILIGSGFSSLVPGSLVTLTVLGNTGDWQ